MIVYTFLFILAAPLPLAVIGALPVTGAIGSFAAGMGRVCGFPAKPGVGCMGGFAKRYARVLLLLYITFLCMLLMAFVWLIAAIPLAVINELAGRGILPQTVFYAALGVTALVFYAGLMFLRVFPVSFLPALCSGSYRPARAALSFAGRNFFCVAKFFLVADAILALVIFIALNSSNSLYALILNCLLSSALVFFFFYSVFDAYAADGYGFDEIDGIIMEDDDIAE
jgi:hypothetical protein